jgi:hypothetical protein
MAAIQRMPKFVEQMPWRARSSHALAGVRHG